MALPKDPNMLLSYINTQLRDNYPDLTELAASLGESEESIREALESAGYTHDTALNRFVTSK